MSDAPAPAEPLQESFGESFGRYLAQQRELRGMSLESVADATKLPLSILRALEADDLARLPERVFVVGSVKAYARCVGLSPEETALRLEEAWGKVPKPEARAAARRSRRAAAAMGATLALAAAGLAFLLLHHGAAR